MVMETGKNENFGEYGEAVENDKEGDTDIDDENEYEYKYEDLSDEADRVVDVDVMTDDDEHIEILLHGTKVRKRKSLSKRVLHQNGRVRKNMENTRRKRVEEFVQDEGNKSAHGTDNGEGSDEEGGTSDKKRSFKAWHSDRRF